MGTATLEVAAPAYAVAWRPHDGPQTALLACPLKDVLYGGARGGGKSAGLLMDFAAHAQKYGRHARGILFRRTYPELEELERQADGFFAPLGWIWKAQPRTWEAPNGATLRLRYLDKDTDAAGYQGHEYTWQGFDECGNWPSAKGMDTLAATLRSPHGVPCVRRLTANPGGPGHLWLKKRYVDPAQPFTPFTNEVGFRSVYIPATLDDNPDLPADYETTIKAATFGNDALWQAWRFGSWDVIAGAAFAEWNREVHTMKPRAVPGHWPRVVGLDWGYRKGAAHLVACGPEDELEVLAEAVLERMNADDAGAYCASVFAPLGPVQMIVASPDMWTETGAGVSLAQNFAQGWQSVTEKPCPITEGDQSPGQRRIKKMLMHEALAWENVRDADGRVERWAMPRLRIHTTCTYLITSLPSLPVDPDKPEDDIDTTADDHGYDDIGFVLAAKPSKRKPLPEALPSVKVSSEIRADAFDVKSGRITRPKSTADQLREQHPRGFETRVKAPRHRMATKLEES